MVRGAFYRFLLVVGFMVSIAAPAAFVRADTSHASDIHLFLSPYCGICQQRFAEAVPVFPSLEAQGGHVEFDLIALRGDASEVSMLQHLVCADAQDRFIPYFLFVSRAIREGRAVHHDRLAQTLGLDTDAFHQCLGDSARTDEVLERSRAIFDTFALRGVPSVVVKGKAFTFRDMGEVVDVYRSEG